MRVDEWVSTLFSVHGEKRYAFCSKRCLERFQEDPIAYVQRLAVEGERSGTILKE
jgi:YHS domain-containing protein